MTVIHNMAKVGFSNAQAYDTHRPSYPADAVESILGHMGVAQKPHSRIVDLAAGTGKFTELLARREEKYEIYAVEPHDSMRQTLEEKKLPGVELRGGAAEKMDVPDEWADAVVVAQAFHWFSNDTALKEIHRILKPGGKFAVIWNLENYNKPKAWPAETQWEEAMNALVFSLPTDGSTRFRDFVWKDVFQRQGKEPLFATPLKEGTISWTVMLTPGRLFDRMNTLSQIAVLQGADRDAFRSRFDEILRGDDCEWNDAGEVVTHGVTYSAWTTKL